MEGGGRQVDRQTDRQRGRERGRERERQVGTDRLTETRRDGRSCDRLRGNSETEGREGKGRGRGGGRRQRQVERH